MTTTAASIRLDEAKVAYHQLATGGLPVEVRNSNGETVRYSVANMSRLREYIRELEAEVARNGAAQQPISPLRPIWG